MIFDTTLCPVLIEPGWEECGDTVKWRMGKEGSEEMILICDSHRDYFIQYGAILELINGGNTQ